MRQNKKKERVIILSKIKSQHQKLIEELPPVRQRSWEKHLVPLSRLIFLENRALVALYDEEPIGFRLCVNKAKRILAIEYSQYWYRVALDRLKSQRRRIANATFLESLEEPTDTSPPTEEPKKDSTHKRTPPITEESPDQFCLFRNRNYGRNT